MAALPATALWSQVLPRRNNSEERVRDQQATLGSTRSQERRPSLETFQPKQPPEVSLPETRTYRHACCDVLCGFRLSDSELAVGRVVSGRVVCTYVRGKFLQYEVDLFPWEYYCVLYHPRRGYNLSPA